MQRHDDSEIEVDLSTVVPDQFAGISVDFARVEFGDQFDALVLAEAGLSRLGFADRITQKLPPDIVLPAVGQGALGIETRDNDPATLQAVAALDHLVRRLREARFVTVDRGKRGEAGQEAGQRHQHDDGETGCPRSGDAVDEASDDDGETAETAPVDARHCFAAHPTNRPPTTQGPRPERDTG